MKRQPQKYCKHLNTKPLTIIHHSPLSKEIKNVFKNCKKVFGKCNKIKKEATLKGPHFPTPQIKQNFTTHPQPPYFPTPRYNILRETNYSC